MKTFLLLSTIITVQWFLDFKQNYSSENPQTFIRSANFEEQMDVVRFIIRAPKEGEWWECMESTTGRYGYCRVRGIHWKI